MTKPTAPHLNTQIAEISPQIHYLVAMSQTENHLFEVTLDIINYPSEILDLKMPVWTPGSYLV
ncbi:MAG: peptidase M61, partial [Dolichospermum sp.]